MCYPNRLFLQTVNPPKERCSSGWRGTPGKRVIGKTDSGVRIPLFPQKVHIVRNVLRKALGQVRIAVTRFVFSAILLFTSLTKAHWNNTLYGLIAIFTRNFVWGADWLRSSRIWGSRGQTWHEVCPYIRAIGRVGGYLKPNSLHI